MKIYIVTIVLTLLLQIFVSFYTTNKLVIQSQTYQHHTTRLDQLKRTNQQLSNQYSQLTSKAFLKQQVDQLNLYPLTKHLDLSQ